jgi:hypothetical protein
MRPPPPPLNLVTNIIWHIHFTDNMRKILIIPLVLLSIQCTNKSRIISSNKVKSIVITLDTTTEHLVLAKIEIRNKDSLKQIIEKINECESEPIKFYPTHRLKVTYEDGQEKMILCSGSSLKFDGLTYRLKDSIRDIVGY